jgi:RimJ/RimL family protein N-acetyltransferase
LILTRRIRPGEGELFRELRLASLKESPSAFSTAFESAINRSLESWREQADRTATGTDCCTFLAFSDGSPIGIAAIYQNNDNKAEGELAQVWVSPDFRGSTAAQELLDAIFQWCQENGIRKVFATIKAGNERALKFYRKYGFGIEQSSMCNALGSMVLVKESDACPRG